MKVLFLGISSHSIDVDHEKDSDLMALVSNHPITSDAHDADDQAIVQDNRPLLALPTGNPLPTESSSVGF